MASGDLSNPSQGLDGGMGGYDSAASYAGSSAINNNTMNNYNNNTYNPDFPSDYPPTDYTQSYYNQNDTYSANQQYQQLYQNAMYQMYPSYYSYTDPSTYGYVAVIFFC